VVEIKEEVAVRRSSRQRKLLYGTFDPKILDRALYVDKQSYEHEEDSPRKKYVDKQSYEHEEDNPRKKRRVEETNGVNNDVRKELFYTVRYVILHRHGYSVIL
jgi:hypothetical protein